MITRELPSQEYLRECFDYDEHSGVVTWRNRPARHFSTNDMRGSQWLANWWNSRYAGRQITYVSPTTGFIVTNLSSKTPPIHVQRLIWKWMTGKDAPRVGHWNGDRADNRWINLREATVTQSCHAARRRRDNASGFKGVKLDKRYGGFIARIRVNGHDRHIGKFHEAKDAHAAYCAAARESFGEFWNPG